MPRHGLLTTLASLALAASALTGCGSSDDTPSPAGTTATDAGSDASPSDASSDAADAADAASDAASDAEAGASISLLEGDCDPMVPSECGFPFPSNVWLVDDPTTKTGKRVAFGALDVHFDHVAAVHGQLGADLINGGHANTRNVRSVQGVHGETRRRAPDGEPLLAVYNQRKTLDLYWERDGAVGVAGALQFAHAFLGLRLQCAQCHHHPYERWGQADYYGLAGFFARLGRKSFGEPPPYYSAANVTTGEKDPLTGKAPEPKFPDGPAARFSPEDDPRHALVDWMAKPENPFFAKALANRLGTSHQTVSARRRRGDLADWSRGLDPEGLAWGPVSGNGTYLPVPA